MYIGKDFATVEMCIKDGELRVGKAVRKDACVRDVDTALHRLLAGETVHVLQTGALVTAIQKTLRMVLGGNR